MQDLGSMAWCSSKIDFLLETGVILRCRSITQLQAMLLRDASSLLVSRRIVPFQGLMEVPFMVQATNREGMRKQVRLVILR